MKNKNQKGRSGLQGDIRGNSGKFAKDLMTEADEYLTKRIN